MDPVNQAELDPCLAHPGLGTSTLFLQHKQDILQQSSWLSTQLSISTEFSPHHMGVLAGVILRPQESRPLKEKLGQGNRLETLPFEGLEHFSFLCFSGTN